MLNVTITRYGNLHSGVFGNPKISDRCLVNSSTVYEINKYSRDFKKDKSYLMTL